MTETFLRFTEHAVGMVFDYWPTPTPSQDLLSQVRIVAHRGAAGPGFNENKIAGFLSCAAAGVWAVEFDVRWTQDQVPIVLHDPGTKRTYNLDLQPSHLKAQQLIQALPLLPTLQQVVQQVGSRCHLFIECKELLTPEREEILLQSLHPLLPEEHFHLLTLDPRLLSSCQKVARRAMVLVSEINAKSVSNYALEQKWGGIAGHFLLQSTDMIRAHHKAGQKVGVGFLTSFNNVCRQIHRGADWLFSNQALILQHSLQRSLDRL